MYLMEESFMQANHKIYGLRLEISVVKHLF